MTRLVKLASAAKSATVSAVLAISAAGGLSIGDVAAEDNLYFALRGFGGWSDPGDISSTGTGTISERNTADPAAGGGAAIGWKFGDEMPIRVEAEILHRVRVDVDLRDTTNGVGYENNLSSTTAMLGMAYEFRNESAWTPFVGGHAGWARNTSSVDRTVVATGALTTTEESTDNLAVAADIGVDYALTEVIDLGVGYRFSYLGEFDTGRLANGESIEGSPFLAHDLMLSVQFNF
ncbi:outer membrane beta-barrel protein [Rhodospirillaceae bacterium KN72]|uniref:Outer membrane beta-barrel protein n=1 Tax=Pacificispira spongiicola TaxID=2729598 RepID=A0A7Y0E0N1_9PROT|nr:outer membrane beta-barrel protein [Pacificispira spongiicola]NMM44973.1 outer membrane beta-barrel protein [Pacificispira spongiicola]